MALFRLVLLSCVIRGFTSHMSSKLKAQRNKKILSFLLSAFSLELSAAVTEHL
jgi:hypothetical protein